MVKGLDMKIKTPRVGKEAIDAQMISYKHQHIQVREETPSSIPMTESSSDEDPLIRETQSKVNI